MSEKDLGLNSSGNADETNRVPTPEQQGTRETLVFPPVVSKRNEFYSTRQIAEDYWPSLPPYARDEQMLTWLHHYTDRVIDLIDHAFAQGAERGAAQVANLLKDPDYYVTLRERRKRERERNQQHQKAFEQEQHERRVCPTPDQIANDIRYLEEWIPREDQHVENMKIKLAQLKELQKKPKHVRIADFRR